GMYLLVQMLSPPPVFALFPYTTLFRSALIGDYGDLHNLSKEKKKTDEDLEIDHEIFDWTDDWIDIDEPWRPVQPTTPKKNESNADRKSTRLNSSHVSISYAVFCLKKKN